MELGKDFETFVDRLYSKKQRPPCKGYEMVIMGANEAKSKAGNTQLILKLDITRGEHAGFFSERPLWYFLPYHTDGLKERLARTLRVIVGDNPGVFAEDVFKQEDFDESKLIGLICGGVLKHNDRGYLAMHYITTIDEALQAPVAEAPKIEDKPAVEAGEAVETDPFA